MEQPNDQERHENEKGFSRRDVLRSALALGGTAVIASLEACAPATAPAPAPAATAAPGAPAATAVVTVAPTTAPAAGRSGGQFVMLDGNDVTTLDPHQSGDVSYTFNLLRATHESLVEYVVKPNKEVGIGPLLAKAWDSKDAKVWDFTLNPNIKFLDGTPCDAEAIKYNFERILGLKLGPSGRIGAIDKIEALNKETVRFTLPGPNADFLNYVTMMLMVSPKSIKDHEQAGDLAKAWANDNLTAGTGPFRVKSAIKASEYVLERNPEYWRGWAGNHVDSIAIKIVKEASTRFLLLDRGEAHLSIGIATTDLDALEKNPNVVVESAQAPGVQQAGLRFRGPLADVNVRQALAWSFDSEGFIKSALRGRGDIAKGLLFTEFRFHDPSMPQMKQDLAKAKDYLKRSAFPNGFELSFMILPTFAPYQTAMGQILQENLKELNIKLNLKPMPDLATFYASMDDTAKGDDMWAWSGAAQTPDYAFQARRQYHSDFMRPKGVNGGYKNPKMDALLDEDVKTLDTNRRKELWFQIQRLLVDDMPFMPFAIPRVHWTRRKNVEGLPYNVYSLVPNYYTVALTS